MHTLFKTSLVAFATLGLIAAPLSAAPKSMVKEKGHFTVTSALTATVAAPVGATASAEIEVTKEKFKSEASAELTLTTSGLGAGEYSLDATLADATIVPVGTFTVAGSPTAPVVFDLPVTLDAGSIVSLSISDAASTVLFEGELVAGTVTWKFIANVQVSGPEVTEPKGKKVHGHAVVHSFIKDSIETKRGFLLVGFGAPRDTDLTINVDGVAVGTVLSSKQGKVFIHEIAETVVLRDMKLVTLTDALGAVVMQAEF